MYNNVYTLIIGDTTALPVCSVADFQKASLELLAKESEQQQKAGKTCSLSSPSVDQLNHFRLKQVRTWLWWTHWHPLGPEINQL